MFKNLVVSIFLISLIDIGSGFLFHRMKSKAKFNHKLKMVEHRNTIIIHKSMGEQNVLEEREDLNSESLKMKREYNLQVGKCTEVLRRDLPLVFHSSDIDFSIFSSQIIVSDSNGNRLVVQKSIYTTFIKFLKLSIYPSINLKKVEYIEDCSTIQCLVHIVLPDSIRIEEFDIWEGMFYFGLDSQGYISSHSFDRKISKKTPLNQINAKSFPWIQSSSPWIPDLFVRAVPALSDKKELEFFSSF